MVSPKALLSPPAKPAMNILEVPEPFRKVTPGNAGPNSIQNSIDEQTIVPRRCSNMSNTTRQQIFDSIPLVVSYTISQHGS
jgi:hypothetical protein